MLSSQLRNCFQSLFFVFFYLLTTASVAGSLTLVSPAFKNGDNIPAQFTCNGSDVSPPLYWQNPPENTVSFALIVNDVDAPTGDWVHWLIFNIPAQVWLLSEAAGLPERRSVVETVGMQTAIVVLVLQMVGIIIFFAYMPWIVI